MNHDASLRASDCSIQMTITKHGAGELTAAEREALAHDVPLATRDAKIRTSKLARFAP
jgi:hypothetical protein